MRPPGLWFESTSTGAFEIRTDPFGLCPRYCAQVDGGWEFASDPGLLDVNRYVLDPAGLHGYLSFSYVAQSSAALAGISCIAPGVSSTISPSTTEAEIQKLAACRPRSAGDWRALSTMESVDDPESTLDRLLLNAVLCAVPESREVAVYLSGGLDSSLIAALLVHCGVRPICFTLDFGAPFNLELDCARQVAGHLGLPLHIVDARPRTIRRHLDATAAALHQPFGDAVTVPLYLLGKAAADYAEVVFNGEGGDQLFGGWANKPMIAAHLYGNDDRVSAYMDTFHRFYGHTDRFYSDAAKSMTSTIDVTDWVRPALDVDGDFLHVLRAANLALKGAQNIAPRAVQLGAAHGLDVRSPFFDEALAAWTFTLPSEMFLQGAVEKYLLKRVASKYLPDDIVWREKRGMGAPSTEWCTGTLRFELRRRLSPRRIARDGWFSPAVQGLIRGGDDEGEFRRRRLGEKLWALLMLHAWVDTRTWPVTWPTGR